MLLNIGIWLLIGLGIGFLMELIFRGPKFGLTDSLIIGLAGGLAGGILAQYLINPAPDAPLHWSTLITAAIVALFLVGVLKWITRGTTY
jgi:uncharacterized membrane protein YeaQ/YmgE (transglycosylase-associated protein family)